MAFAHGKGTKVAIEGVNATSYLNEATTSNSVDTAETSCFGQDDKTFIIGMGDGTASISGIFDGTADGIDEKLVAQLGVQDGAHFTVLKEGDSGGPGARCAFAIGDITSYEVTSPVADVVSLTAEIQATGGLLHGVYLSAAGTGQAFQSITSASGTVNNTSVDQTSSSADGGVGQLHVMGNTLDGNLTVKIQDSANNSTWADLISFTVVGATTDTAEQISVAGTVDRYVRATITEAGTTGSCEVAVSFKRN